MLPMNDKAKIIRFSGEPNAFGEYDTQSEKEYRCRISYNSKRDTVKVAGGYDITYTAVILFNGLLQASYEDFFTFADVLQKETTKKAEIISFNRDLSGNILYTKVVV